jgi:transcriptional regulator with XRE-family HTH domain
MHTKQQTVARYETEQLGIDAETICTLCDIFGCTADYLLCRSSRPVPELTPAEEELLLAYAAAPREIRTIVDTALAPYQKSTESSTA